MVDGSIRIDTKIDQSGVDSGLSQIESSCRSFAAVATGIFAGISVFEFGKAALKSTADIELAQAKLETLLGNAADAQSMINDIVKMADTTPYNSNDLIQAATTLKTFGVTADQIMPTLTALGNAAGGQASNLQGVAYALGQTAAQGKMMTQDLYQFINAGVPLLDLLAKQLNKSKTEIKGMVEEGKIGYAEVNAALQAFYTGNGKYAGLMAQAAQTLPGMWSTLQDSVTSFGRALITILEPALKRALGFLSAVFSTLANAPGYVKQLIVLFLTFAGSFVSLSIGVGAARKAFELFFTVLKMNPIMLVISLISALILKMYMLNDAAQVQTFLNPDEAERSIELYDKLIQKQDELQQAGERAGDRALPEQNYKDVAASMERNVGLLDQMEYGTEQWSEKSAEIAAQYRFLENLKTAPFVHEEDLRRAGELEEKFKAIYTAKRKEAAKNLPDITAGDQKQADKRRAIVEALLSWEAEQTRGANAGKIRDLENQTAEELSLIKSGAARIEEAKTTHENAVKAIEESGLENKDELIKEENDRYAAEIAGLQDTNHAIELEIERHNKQVKLLQIEGMIADRQKESENSWFQNFMLDYGNYDKDVYRVLKKSAHYDSLLAFDLGLGISEETALGIDSGIHSVVSAVESIGEAIADTFTAVMELFDIGAGVLDWIVDFNYSDLETKLTKYINAIDSFFKNNLGSMSILFDLGAKMVEQLLAGLLLNLPAIVSSVGNLIQHIADYIVNNGEALISSTLTIVFALVNKLVEKAPEMFRAVVMAVIYFIEDLASKASTFTAVVGEAISGLIRAAVAALPRLLIALVTLAINLLNAIVAQLPQIFQTIAQSLGPLADALALAIPPLLIGIINAIVPLALAIVNALPQIFEALVNAIPLLIEQLILASPQIIAGLAKAIALIIIRVIPAANIAVAKMFMSLHVAIVKWFYKIYLAAAVAIGEMSKMLWSYMQRAGKNLIDGFVDGILTAGSYIWQKVKRVFTGFIDAIKNFFGIHSPSVVFYGFGVNIIQGLINGMLSIGSMLGNILISILSSALSGIQYFLESFASFGSSIASAIISGFTSSASGISGALTSALQDTLDVFDSWTQSFFDAGKSIGSQMVAGINSALGTAGDTLGGIIKQVYDGVGGWLPSIDLPDWFASGTKSAPGGWSVVGEKGPELMNLKSGSTILNASDSIRAVMGALAPRATVAPSASFSFAGEISAADVVIDGAAVGKIAFRYIDKQVKAAYGA